VILTKINKFDLTDFFFNLMLCFSYRYIFYLSLDVLISRTRPLITELVETSHWLFGGPSPNLDLSNHTTFSPFYCHVPVPFQHVLSYGYSEPEFLNIYWRLKSQHFEETCLFRGQSVQQGSFWQQFLGVDCKDYFLCEQLRKKSK
jgi:hypothetical protein